MKKNILLWVVSISFGIWLYTKKEMYPHRGLEYLGIINNTISINVEMTEVEKENLSVLLISEKYRITRLDKFKKNFKDTLIIFDKKLVNDNIPDYSRENRFMIKYKNKVYKIKGAGIFKRRVWFKHDYWMVIRKSNDNIIIIWEINNFWDSKKGIDTISLVSEHLSPRSPQF
jgi:hypothetical protein